MKKVFALASSMWAVMAASASAAASGKIFGADHALRGTSIAQGNRHGGPHFHEREIARRRRQQARQAA
jgi:hypothetical protein